MVPVIDLMRRFHLGDPATCWRRGPSFSDGGRGANLDEAALASSAEVLTIAESDVHPAPAFGADIDVEYLAGMVHIGDELVLLLNVDRVLSTEDLLRTREGMARQDPLVAEGADVRAQP
jgi:purine-binding chemotaxis protein CheW